MLLNVILTTYNRKLFLEKALKSLLAQTDDRWRCFVMDDNSDDGSWMLIKEIAATDPHFVRFKYNTTKAEREATTRYSVLINDVLPKLEEGIVGFMCDNVEYHPDLTGTVLRFFEKQPDIFSGYVNHQRDAYLLTGERVGKADVFGHWNNTPPYYTAYLTPNGNLDHSQVFHRLPVSIRWDESHLARHRGDGLYFQKLVNEYGPIYPIAKKVMTTEHLFK